MRQVWVARVQGGGGRFERAALYVDEGGRFVFETSSQSAGSADRAVIDRDDVVRLAEVLDEVLADGGGS